MYIVNNGNINQITGRAEGNGSVTEIENAQNATTRVIRFIGKGQGSTINAANSGSIWSIVLGDSEVFEAQNSGATIDFVNDKDKWLTLNFIC